MITDLFRKTVYIAILFLIVLPASRLHGQTGSWDQVDRIVAVGDIHGDFSKLVTVLRASAIIDDQNKWIGGKTHLVQTGDVLDRGPDSQKAMRLLMQLETEASNAGGAVHALIGNHEAMVLSGDFRYVSPEDFASLGGEEGFRTALSPAGEFGKWILSHDSVIRINDLLFVHGGIGPTYNQHSIETINASIRKELASGDKSKTAMSQAEDGPLWYRDLTSKPEADLEKDLTGIFKAFNVHHLIVGHTISKDGIQTRGNGGLIMIDVGLSSVYGGTHTECLVIDKGEFFVVGPETKTKLAGIPILSEVRQ